MQFVSLEKRIINFVSLNWNLGLHLIVFFIYYFVY